MAGFGEVETRVLSTTPSLVTCQVYVDTRRLLSTVAPEQYSKSTLASINRRDVCSIVTTGGDERVTDRIGPADTTWIVAVDVVRGSVDDCKKFRRPSEM